MTAIAFNPFAPEFRLDPYPPLAALRAADPVHFIEATGMWILTRYADVTAVLRDERFSSKRVLFQQVTAARGQPPALLAKAAGTMIFSDPPEHTRLRMLVSKAFTPRMIEGLRPRVQVLVDEMLDAIVPRGRMELIGELAFPLPLVVISELLGVPPTDRQRMKRWSDDLAVLVDRTMAFERIDAAEESAAELSAYLREIFAARRADPRDDLISGLVFAQEHGDALSEEELIYTCMLLLAAGHETTVNLIGNGILALLRNPAQLARLRADPSLMRSTVEEILRYDSPVLFVNRTALADVLVDGRVIRTGQEAVCVVGAANRDPARFADPDRFDVGREDNRHLAFGHGVHFCLGAPLARLEGGVALEALLRRLPAMRLESEALEWRDGLVLRGLKALPLSF